MQVFPSNVPASNTYEDGSERARQNAVHDRSFETIYSSFIEEGREKYTGLPNGFSALVPEGGTISRQQADLLRDELKKRNVHEASLTCLDQLLDSGQAMSIGKIFSLLGSEGQSVDPLGDIEKNDFTQLMRKIGLDKETTADLLYMAEKGQAARAWQKISEHMQNLDDQTIEMHEDELRATLKALGISQDAQKASCNAFKRMSQGELGPEELATIFAAADKEIAAKVQASQLVKNVMRDAMNEAMQAAILKEKSDPVANTRGSKNSISNEAKIRHALSDKALQMDADSAQGQNTGMSKGLNEQVAADQNLSGHDHNAAEREADRKHGRGEQNKNLFNANTQKVSNDAQRTRSTTSPDKSMQDLASKITVQGQSFTTNESQNVEPQRVQNLQREIFSQIEQGVYQTGKNGSNHMTLQVNTGEGSTVTLLLTVTNGEVRATMRTDNPEEANLLTERLADLKASLEENGLKVAQLDVETKLGEDSSFGQWDGTNEHNLMRDAQERARLVRLNNLRREEGLSSTAAPVTAQGSANSLRTGLNIIA